MNLFMYVCGPHDCRSRGLFSYLGQWRCIGHYLTIRFFEVIKRNISLVSESSFKLHHVNNSAASAAIGASHVDRVDHIIIPRVFERKFKSDITGLARQPSQLFRAYLIK